MNAYVQIPTDRILLPRSLVGRYLSAQPQAMRWKVGQLVQYLAKTWVVQYKQSCGNHRLYSLVRHEGGLEITALIKDTSAGLSMLHEDRNETPYSPPPI